MTKFSPNIAQISKPLRGLLSSKNAWIWEAPQEESFAKLKEDIFLSIEYWDSMTHQQVPKLV